MCAVLSSTDATAWLQLAGTCKITHAVTVVALRWVAHELDSRQKVPAERYMLGNAVVGDSWICEVEDQGPMHLVWYLAVRASQEFNML